jgi:hypothetical protein
MRYWQHIARAAARCIHLKLSQESAMVKNSKFVQMIFASLLVAGAVAWVAGCKSDQPKSEAPAPAPAPVAEKPAPPQPVSLAVIKQNLIEAKAQVQATTDSLAKLSASSTADAVPNYNAFSEQLAKLQTKAEETKNRANDLRKRGADYLAMWNKQATVQNPELRRQAIEQQGQAQQTLNQLTSEMDATREEFQPFMANLTDVSNYLRGNVTPANLQSTSGLVTKATEQGNSVNQHIDGVIGALDSVAVALGQSTAAPQAKGGAPAGGSAAQPAADTQTPAPSTPAAPNTPADNSAK